MAQYLPAYGEALAWTAPEGGDKESICYRVKLGVTESATPYQATEETFGLTAPISSSSISRAAITWRGASKQPGA